MAYGGVHATGGGADELNRYLTLGAGAVVSLIASTVVLIQGKERIANAPLVAGAVLVLGGALTWWCAPQVKSPPARKKS